MMAVKGEKRVQQRHIPTFPYLLTTSWTIVFDLTMASAPTEEMKDLAINGSEMADVRAQKKAAKKAAKAAKAEKKGEKPPPGDC